MAISNRLHYVFFPSAYPFIDLSSCRRIWLENKRERKNKYWHEVNVFQDRSNVVGVLMFSSEVQG